MNDLQTVEILRALGDEVRLSIVRKVAAADGAVAGCDIVSCASVHALSQPAMSHHFGKLTKAGVLVESKDGTSKRYRVNREALMQVGIDITKL